MKLDTQFVLELQRSLNDSGATPKLAVDGNYGPKTAEALKVHFTPKPDAVPVQSGEAFTRAKLAIFSEQLCSQNIKVGSEKHHEIIKQFAEKPVSFGYGNWAWCAATVTYECKNVGLNIPAVPGTGWTFAFVEAWQVWAQKKGFYHDNDSKKSFKPEAGDIVIYDWTQTNVDQPDNNQESHIGVHLRMSGDKYVAAEGNTGGQTAIRTRPAVNIQGWVRIPDGYVFPV